MRPAKLTPPTVLVIWGARELTLAEKVVWYRDWSLDDGKGPNGCYAAPSALAKGLGDSLTAGSVSTIRQRLKRLGLHLAVDRGPGANCGWIATVPAEYRARTAREAATLALGLDQHIRNHDRGLVAVEPEASTPRPATANETSTPSPVESQFHGEQNGASMRSGRHSGGVGGASFSVPVRQAQLPSRVREKGVSADAPELQKGEQRDPAVVRAEGLALIRLHLGKKLTPDERRLVDEWEKRQGQRKTGT
jgi:hypothetical protein